MDLRIRLKKISLTNFRNIEHAVVDIPGANISDLLEEKSSVLGIYGQNGSGKSSLLLALRVLKAALSGTELNHPAFASCIKIGCKYSTLVFDFSACNKSGTEYEINYSFNLRPYNLEKDYKQDSEEIEEYLKFSGYGNYFSEDLKKTLNTYTRPSIVIYDEVLKYSSKTKNGKTNKQILIDTTYKACKASGRAFGNKGRYEQFTAKAKSSIHDALCKAKKEAVIKATSFVFSAPVSCALIESGGIAIHKKILESLIDYGKNYLFIISSNETAQNGMKILPLAIWAQNKKGRAFGVIYPLMLFEHCKVIEDLFPFVKDSIPSISNIVTKIVPGLTLEIDNIRKCVEQDIEFQEFDLFVVRDETRIPLAFESEGTRRIISFISLLAAVYNNPSVTIAIDEIDSGIFEFLLGEILSIMKHSAKGQLIFTSHNLIPLDKNFLPYKNLLFTIRDPEVNFVKLEGTSGNNNLKDRYFSLINNKDINSKIKHSFYNPINRENIERAFSEAGQLNSLPDIG